MPKATVSLSGIEQSTIAIDVLITDIGLPGGMNGRQMANIGRSSRPDLKILSITGYAKSAALDKIKMPILTKPFAIGILTAKVQELLTLP